MKTFALLVFATLWIIHIRLASADYRYRRMPPQPPRPPPIPAYLKKWHNAHMRQSMNRPRPIPVHLPPPQQQQLQQQQQQPQKYKKPIGPPISLPAPKRSIQQQQQQQLPTIRPKVVTQPPQVPKWSNNQVYLTRQQEKPFLGSPKVQVPVNEYDYHIQTNQIPNHSNLIKQVDEKGPIHTIPAPNLSLADKPKHVEIQAPKQQKTVVEVQKAHQYQVTEAGDYVKGYKQDFGGYQQQESHVSFQQETKSPEFAVYQHESKMPEGLKTYQTDFLKNTYHAQETPLLQTEAVLTPNDQLSQVSQQDLYKFFQNYQQPLIETYNIPTLQQPQLQEHLMQQQAYQTLIAQQPVYQADANAFLAQLKPEYHTFNYEEPTQKSAASSQVSAEYTIQSEPNIPANNVDSEVNYFQNFQNYPGITEDVDPVSFYTSLPNKEAADSLSALQEAGKRTSANSQEEPAASRETGSAGMAIYVPDESEETGEKEEGGEAKDASYEEDYADDEASASSHEEEKGGDAFGSRIKPKKY